MGRYSGNHVNKLPQRSISMNNFRGAGSTNICLFPTVDRRSWPMTKLKDICRLKLHSRDSISSSLGKIQKLKKYYKWVFHLFNGENSNYYIAEWRSGLTDFSVENQRLLYAIIPYMWTQCLNNQQPTNNN